MAENIEIERLSVLQKIGATFDTLKGGGRSRSWRLLFAQVVNIWHDRVCWVDLYQWSEGERTWSEDINWNCTDMETSRDCQSCWCMKICRKGYR